MPDTLTPNYTPEELDTAKKDLEKMKPEDLLALRTELELAQDALNLPEAPAIAFMELRAPSGAKINLTVRAGSGALVLDALAQAVAHARDRYSMTTTGTPVSNTPVPMEQQTPPLPTEETSDEALIIAPSGVAKQIAQQPVYTTMNAQPTVDIPVESITRERKRDGKGDFLRVRGGKFTKFGVPCYPEKFPAGLDLNKMAYGLEFTNIPASMRVATVQDAKPYHVIAFHE